MIGRKPPSACFFRFLCPSSKAGAKGESRSKAKVIYALVAPMGMHPGGMVAPGSGVNRLRAVIMA